VKRSGPVHRSGCELIAPCLLVYIYNWLQRSRFDGTFTIITTRKERVRPRNKVSVYVVELLQGSNLNTVDGVIQPGAQISRLWVRSVGFKGGTCMPGWEGKLASQASTLVSPSVVNAYSH
jgi:hypothetical protein